MPTWKVVITKTDEYTVNAPNEQAAIDLVLEGDPNVEDHGGWTNGVATEIKGLPEGAEIVGGVLYPEGAPKPTKPSECQTP